MSKIFKKSLKPAIKFDRLLKRAEYRFHKKRCSGIREWECDYLVLVNYQLLRLKYRSISPPSPITYSLLNIDEMDYSF